MLDAKYLPDKSNKKFPFYPMPGSAYDTQTKIVGCLFSSEMPKTYKYFGTYSST